MARSKSSGRWLREHFRDPYVRRSQQEGYRSRAVYKLIELDRKVGLLKPGLRVVDLGAAPGGWTQYAAERVGGGGRVLASDILPMDSFADVEFIQGDFTEPEVLERLLQAIGEEGVDLVMSDMAPNMSGVNAVDQPRAMVLAELALELALRVLRPGGDFLTKLFQGEGVDEFIAALRRDFERVSVRKPGASRSRSREVYALARSRKL